MICQDTGPRDAKVMIVGEAPGVDEERCGRPFVGSSGKLLRSMLKHCGLDFNSCYVTNVMNVRPPGNKFDYFYEGKGRDKVPTKELEAAQEKLRKKIEELKPEVVLLLGNEPLKAICNREGITNWRGCFLEYRGIKIMPTYHPAAVLREYRLHPIFELDVSKALRRAPKPWPLTIISPSLEQVVESIEKAKAAPLVAHDIETIGKNIRSLAIAYPTNNSIEAISIPFIKFPSSDQVSVIGSKVCFNSEGSFSSYWSPEQEVIVLSAIAELFNSGTKIVGQNSISFDEPLIRSEFSFGIKEHYMDLMHAWHLCYCEFPKGLDFISSILSDYPNYWTLKDTSNDKEEWEYNARDAIVTLEACELVEEELRHEGLEEFYRNHIHPLCFDLVTLQERGALVDETIRTAHLEAARRRADGAQEQLKALTGRDTNPASPKQVAQLLYDDLKFPQQRSKKGTVTTDEEALRKLAKAFPQEPVLQTIINYRKAQKLISNYLTVKTSQDGRMRSSYNASGTETWRLSSSSNLFGEGMNLQNIPAGKGLDIVNLRDMFVAPDGKVLLKGDLKQAETMFVAHKLDALGYPQLFELYRDPSFDIHKWTAAFAFNVNIKEVTKNMRNFAKIVNHSGNYGAGPGVLVKTALKFGIDMDYQLAKQLIAKKQAQLPELLKWWEWVEKKLKRDRTLSNCFGARRVFFGRVDSTTVREAIAWEPQSTVGILNNVILRRLSKPGVLPPGCFPILQVHDEIVIECWESCLSECVGAFQAASMVPLSISKKEPLIIPVELSSGKNWKDQKEIVT